MNKIKKDDLVVILSGKDKGRSGKIIKVDGCRVLVEGVNMQKKHVKPNPQKQQQGGIIEREAAVHVSTVSLLNPISKKADKVGFKTLPAKTAGQRAKKVRYFKSNGEMVDVVGG